MIELIVVIFIMAIMAAYAAPRFFARGDVEGPGYAQELASAARYAQRFAVSTGCPVRLTVASTGYSLVQPQNAPTASACDTSFTRNVLHPGNGNAFSASVPPGVTIGGALPLTIQYSAGGTPSLDGGVTELASDLGIPVGTATVVIAAHSGFVEVQ